MCWCMDDGVELDRRVFGLFVNRVLGPACLYYTRQNPPEDDVFQAFDGDCHFCQDAGDLKPKEFGSTGPSRLSSWIPSFTLPGMSTSTPDQHSIES